MNELLTAGYSKRDYGDRMAYYFRGEEGAVQFVYWATPAMGLDVGYHSGRPMYSNDMRECGLIGENCYYDGSRLTADYWLKEFKASGWDEEWLKQKLIDYYRRVFYRVEEPA